MVTSENVNQKSLGRGLLEVAAAAEYLLKNSAKALPLFRLKKQRRCRLSLVTKKKQRRCCYRCRKSSGPSSAAVPNTAYDKYTLSWNKKQVGTKNGYKVGNFRYISDKIYHKLEQKTPSKSRMAVRYRTFRVCVLRTSHLEPYQRTVLQFNF